MPTFSGAQFAMTVKNIDGTPVKDIQQEFTGEIKDKGNLTLKNAIRYALGLTDKSDEDKKLEYFAIVNKIYYAGPEDQVELTSDEIVLIKNKVKQKWSTEPFGFIVEVLEGKNKEFKLVEKG